MVIGGMFPLERVEGKKELECANTLYFMSGRCALYACLLDAEPRVRARVAYVPAYTCETVVYCYLKAGYELRFYDSDPNGLIPLFKEEDLDGVGVMNLAAYYGFITYDSAFLDKVKERGIIIIQDTTHSPTFIDSHADYAAGSRRKWMGVASGGVATKLTGGAFNIKPLAVEEEHLRGRYKAMEEREEALRSGDNSFNERASQTFWETELRLRKIFDSYGSDELSIRIVRSFDYEAMAKKRRENFEAIVNSLKEPSGYSPVFNKLDASALPSHFTIYADDRERLQAFLRERGISSTVYWPQLPMLENIDSYQGTKWILDHILSIQLDQRYGEGEMKYLANTLNEYSDINGDKK